MRNLNRDELLNFPEIKDRIPYAFQIMTEEHGKIHLNAMRDKINNRLIEKGRDPIGEKKFNRVIQGLEAEDSISILNEIAYETDVSFRFFSCGDIAPKPYHTVSNLLSRWYSFVDLPRDVQEVLGDIFKRIISLVKK